MAGETLGTIRGQMILDVKQALAAYTSARQAHISTVTALHTGAGAMTAAGAGMAAAGAGIAAGFFVAVGAAAEFEKRLDYFVAVGGPDAASSFDAVREKALQLGADTRYSANEIADSFVELGKSGVRAQDIINGIGEGVASLGAAADIPLDTAANIITSAVATFQLGAENAVMVADKLAGAANASIIDVEDLGVSLKYAGGVAASLGVPFQDLNTALAILGENGIKGSTAGTSLRQILLGLNGSTKKAKTALRELGIITEDGGNQFYTAEGKAKSLSEVFDILGKATAGMTDQQRTATMQQIFAVRALPSLIALTREGAAGFEEMAEAINATTALDVANARLDNLAGDLEILRGNIDTLLISSGSGFQSFARFVVQGVTSVIQAFIDLPQWAQTAITGSVAAFGGILIMVGMLGMLAGSILNVIALAIQMAPVLTALATGYRSVAAAVTAYNIALASNPLAIVLAIIGALVGAFIILYNTSETFRNAVQPLFAQLQEVFMALGPIASQVLGQIVIFLTNMANSASSGVGSTVSILGQLASIVGGVLSTAITTVLPVIMNFIGAFVNFLMPLLQAILPMLSTLGQIITAVFSGNFSEAITLVGQFAAQFANVITVLATQIIPVIMQVVTNILVTLIGMTPQLMAMGITLVTSLITGLAQSLPMIVLAAVQLFTTILTTLIGLLPTIIEGAVALVTGIVQALVTALPMLIAGALTLFMGLIQALTVIIPQLISSLVGLIPVIITTLVEALPLLIDAAILLFTSLITGLLEALPLLITALIEGLILVVTTLGESLPLIIEAAITLFLGVMTGLLTALPQIITAVINAVPRIVTALISMLPIIIAGAIQLFMGLVQALITIIPQLIQAQAQLMMTLVGAIVGAVPQLIQAGRDLIQGLINGVGQMAGSLASAAKKVAEGALNSIKDFFGIASPSKVMTVMGQFVMQGLRNGMANMQRDVVNTVTGIAAAVGGVPFELSGMQAMYDSFNAAKSLQLQLTSGDLDAATTRSLVIAQGQEDLNEQDRINVEKLEINYPEPEPISESLPKGLRRAAYMVG